MARESEECTQQLSSPFLGGVFSGFKCKQKRTVVPRSELLSYSNHELLEDFRLLLMGFNSDCIGTFTRKT